MVSSHQNPSSKLCLKCRLIESVRQHVAVPGLLWQLQRSEGFLHRCSQHGLVLQHLTQGTTRQLQQHTYSQINDSNVGFMQFLFSNLKEIHFDGFDHMCVTMWVHLWVFQQSLCVWDKVDCTAAHQVSPSLLHHPCSTSYIRPLLTPATLHHIVTLK